MLCIVHYSVLLRDRCAYAVFGFVVFGCVTGSSKKDRQGCEALTMLLQSLREVLLSEALPAKQTLVSSTTQQEYDDDRINTRLPMGHECLGISVKALPDRESHGS